MKAKVKIISSWIVSFIIVVVAVVIAGVSSRTYYKQAYPMEYVESVDKYSEKYDVDKSLVYAVIRTESGFDPEVTSSVGATGLMQITEDTFEWAQFRKQLEDPIQQQMLFDPIINIQYGAYILSLLIEEFKSEETALAAYHAGWGQVKAWLEDSQYSNDGVNLDYIPFNDTRAYVDKVMETKKTYEKLYNI